MTPNEEALEYDLASLVAKGLITLSRDANGVEVITMTPKGLGTALMLGILPVNLIPGSDAESPDLS